MNTSKFIDDLKSGDVLESQLSYWKQQLSEASPLLELPTDRARPTQLGDREAKLPFTLSKSLSDGLKHLSQQAGTSLFMTLLTAFNTLLYRYTQQSDITVGSPIINRNRPELEGSIGFTNTLALRTNLSGNPSFLDLLKQVRQVVLDAYEHQDLPFEKIVEELQPERNLSYSPLFQVMFVLLDPALSDRQLEDLSVRLEKIEHEAAMFDLTLSMSEDTDRLSGVFKYSTDLFEASTIERTIGHFQTLLAAIVANPEKPIATLPLLTKAERHQLLVEWNDTHQDYPVDKCIHQLFEEQVERSPDAIAVIFQNQQITYRELNERANQLAHYLQSLGVAPEVLVGICVERSVEMVVGLLGILKAGGAYVPIDPTYPSERITYMLDDSQVSILLTQNHLQTTLVEYHGRTIGLDSDWNLIVSQSQRLLRRKTTEPALTVGQKNPISGVTSENLIYTIYTSGSTGKPKGTMNTHQGVANRILWMQDEYQLTTSDRVLQKTPFSFDVSVWEFYWPLIVGARLIVAQPEGHKDANYLVQIITEQEVTTLHFVPSMLQIFLEVPNIESCSSLRQVFCSGEALPIILQERFFTRLKAELHNLYGPTEAAIDVTYWHCRAGERLTSVPIGRPVANTQTYILDGDLQPVPVGIAGELYLGGVQLARGYLNRPELTAQRFIANPFLDDFNSPYLYKTGDLARYLSDGNIEYLGRLDNQVKIRGFRIELGEIEACVAQHPDVRKTAVIAREDTPGDKRLVAYVVPQLEPKNPSKQNNQIHDEHTNNPLQCPSSSNLASILRKWVQEKLPEFMVPSVFVVLETLPLTPNGKLDRRALPNAFPRNLQVDLVAPSTPIQNMLAAMWENILGVEVGIYDNFFELGGDSIKGAIFVNRLQEKIGSIVQILVIFEAPTIAELEVYLKQEYPQQVARILGLKYTAETFTPTSKIDAAKVSQLRQLLPSLPPRRNLTLTKNKRAIFVLSPPRSGSTLLRVILGGHPQLFAPQELFLLSFNSLADRKIAFSGSTEQNFFREGCIHTIKQLQNSSTKQAQKLMQEFEQQELTTKEFFSWMQQLLKEQILVDKTPTYALDFETLKRIEEDFDNPLYIHLSRHPYGMIRSFKKAKLDRVCHALFPTLGKVDRPIFDCVELAELIWLISHQNILKFFQNIPRDRHYHVRFENLVSQPQTIVEGISQFLNLDFEMEMLQPYKEQDKRMTDGLHSVSRMLGDVKFHLHKTIDPAVADAWRKHYTVDFLGDVTWQVAESLGYQKIANLSDELEEGEL